MHLRLSNGSEGPWNELKFVLEDKSFFKKVFEDAVVLSPQVQDVVAF